MSVPDLSPRPIRDEVLVVLEVLVVYLISARDQSATLAADALAALLVYLISARDQSATDNAALAQVYECT